MGRKKKDWKKGKGKDEQSKKPEQETSNMSKSGEPDTTGDKSGTSNDPDWYAMFPQLLADAARLTFSEPLGGRLDLVEDGDNITESASNSIGIQQYLDYAIPGILNLMVKPSVGYATDKQSPVNVAATALYTHVRYMNSGRKNYDVPDLMLYNLSVADLYSFIMWAQKIFSAAYSYSQRNLYIGKCVLESLGIDSDSVINNLANFRYRLNAFISKVAAYAVPATINVFKRKAFMYAGLYIETEDTVKSQLYQFKPAAFYKFDLDSSDLGMLDLKYIDYSVPLDVDAIMSIGEDLLSNMWADEDFGLMSGDILKAFGDNIIKLSPVPDAPVLVPTKDEYVLSQFMNATPVPVQFDQSGAGSSPSGVTYTIPDAGGKIGTYGCVYQNARGLLISEEAVPHAEFWDGTQSALAKASQYIRMHKGLSILHVYNSNPDVGDVAEASRLACAYIGPDSNSQSTANYLVEGGTEVVVQLELWGRNTDSDALGNVILNTNHLFTQNTTGGMKYEYDAALVISMIGHFKYAPVMYAAVFATTPTVQFTHEIGRMFPVTLLANYTRYNSAILSRLNEVALLSLFYVPGIAMMQ